jgi:hypothetical protein
MLFIALYVMFEARYREENGWGPSKWAPYIHVLPTSHPGKIHTVHACRL